MTSGSGQNLASSMPDIKIHHDFRYGDLGKVLFLHGQVYNQEYRFNHEFEAYVAEGLAEFARKYKSDKSCLWIAEEKGDTIGSIAILERDNKQAQLRWFIVHPEYRGKTIGRFLCKKAIEFCQNAGYDSIYLWTLGNLVAARKIYEANGFQLIKKKQNQLWGHNLVEEFYVLKFLITANRQEGKNNI
jgi:ribosomal protein S18 acetylase RimI-like enzyme